MRIAPLAVQGGKHVMAFHIAIIGNLAEVRIGHADLFTLVDVGRALHTVQHHRQHFCGRNAVFTFIAKTRHDAWLVVVTPEQRVPGLIVHALLPVAE